MHGTGVIGHLPKQISIPCHLFIRNDGSIPCVICMLLVGTNILQIYLKVHILEVPCKLKFKRDTKELDKAKLLLQKVLSKKFSYSDKSPQ